MQNPKWPPLANNNYHNFVTNGSNLMMLTAISYISRSAVLLVLLIRVIYFMFRPF